jgi:hypothetical protein
MSNIKKSSIFHRSGVWQRIAGNVCAIALLLAVIVSETAGQVDEAGTRPMISLADAVRSTALRHPGVQIAKEAINLSQAANFEPAVPPAPADPSDHGTAVDSTVAARQFLCHLNYVEPSKLELRFNTPFSERNVDGTYVERWQSNR